MIHVRSYDDSAAMSNIGFISDSPHRAVPTALDLRRLDADGTGLDGV
jgi:hypothetical protein